MKPLFETKDAGIAYVRALGHYDIALRMRRWQIERDGEPEFKCNEKELLDFFGGCDDNR